MPEGQRNETTIDVSDDLYRRAKAEAALRGRKLRDLVEEGLRLVLEAPRRGRPRPSLAELMKRSRGVIDSEVPDLASNPRHLADFGPKCAPPSLIPVRSSPFSTGRNGTIAGSPSA